MEGGAGETTVKNRLYGRSGRLGDTKTNQNLRRGKPRDACRPGVGPDHVQMFLGGSVVLAQKGEKITCGGISRTVSNRRPCAGPLTAVGQARATST